ncbi:MAG: transcriptional regulator, TetR family [Frankiales bacterium]|nr:transcriptional regulator, TetR family [Frankiales bacterium]
MDSTIDTAGRLADAALRALARRGLRKLSVTDICDEAGVARGTLYRYYTDRDDVLQAVEQRILQHVEEALVLAVAERPAVEQRLQVVLGALASYRVAHPEIADLLQDEPVWAREVLGRLFDDLLDVLATALQPVLARAASVVSGALTERQLAEVLLRLVLTARTRSGASTAADTTADLELWEALLVPARRRSALRKAG